MRSAFKTFLIWVVMLAVPLQGVAAAAMLHCGSGHQPSLQTSDAHGDHAAHGHAAHDADDAESAPSISGTCSACAACFWGAALVGTVPGIATAVVGAPPPVAAAVDIETVVPDGLERPPRHVAL